MYIPSHQQPFYLSTKKIVLGGAKPADADLETMKWIASTLGITVLNFEVRTKLLKNKAGIFVRTNAESNKIGQDLANFTQQLITHLAATRPDALYIPASAKAAGRLPEMELEYEAFEHSYLEDALDTIRNTEVGVIRSKFKNIWQLHSNNRSYAVFYHTIAQLEESEKNGTNGLIRKEFADALRRLTPYMSYPADTLSIYFDTKENLDTNYKGDFSNYYR